jgi:AcrR family transcriptional regulator
VTIEAGRSGRRPRNRKAQLTDAAAELFRRRGYHGVSVNDIAAAAGVTGPAVYRHFGGKQDVLAHVLFSGLDRFAEVADAALDADAADHPDAVITKLTAGLSALAVERREVTALWRWQGLHLEKAERRKIRDRAAEIMGRWVLALRKARPDLTEPDATLLAWAALSVFGSVADHHVSLPRRRFERKLCDMANAVLRVQPHPARADESTSEETGWQFEANPPSRREELLSAATTLFRDRGYHAVSMEDIGAQAGIAGPSIYRYFSGKAEILVAAGYRMADRLTLAADRAAESASGPEDALAKLVRSYVDIVLRSDNLMMLYTDPVVDLPDRDARELRRLQRSYVARWVRLLCEVSPGLDTPAARIIVHAALTIVNDLGRTPRVTSRPGIDDELTRLAITVLRTGSLEEPANDK